MRKTEKKKRIAPNAKNLVVGIIAILFFIFSVIILALGILGIIAGWNMLNSDIGIVNFFGLLAFAFGIVLIPVSLLYFFVGRGLRKRQKWARITAIILCLLVVANTIVPIVQDIIVSVASGSVNWGTFIINAIALALNLVIALYLIFNKGAKKAFS